MSLEAFKKFPYLYVIENIEHSKEKRVHAYKIKIKDLNLSIIDLKDNQERYSGFINVSCSSIICIIQNNVTQNTTIFKILLRFLTSAQIIPFTYLGHKSSTNEEIAEYGIFSKEELKEEIVMELLDLENIKFSEIEKELIKRIKDQEFHY